MNAGQKKSGNILCDENSTLYLRKDTGRWLVGQPISSFSSLKLPSNRDVFKRLFFIQDSLKPRNISKEDASKLRELKMIYRRSPAET